MVGNGFYHESVQHYGHSPTTLSLAEDILINIIIIVLIISVKLVWKNIFTSRYRSSSTTEPHLTRSLAYTENLQVDNEIENKLV